MEAGPRVDPRALDTTYISGADLGILLGAKRRDLRQKDSANSVIVCFVSMVFSHGPLETKKCCKNIMLMLTNTHRSALQGSDQSAS